jgi:hypothetical protein
VYFYVHHKFFPFAPHNKIYEVDRDYTFPYFIDMEFEIQVTKFLPLVRKPHIFSLCFFLSCSKIDLLKMILLLHFKFLFLRNAYHFSVST